MEQQLIEISEQQKATWNKFSPGWRKWDDLTMDFLEPQSDEIIRLLNPRQNELVLDIAAGTGEPGLTIAGIVKKGKVIITDLSDGMLGVARQKANAQALANVEIRQCDVSNLPFADNTFDSISCRLGFMFFPDMLLAAKEMFRVLKPGGKIVTTVWGSPDKNFWATAVLEVINRNMEMPRPPAGSPGLYRCAQRGLLADLLSQAGFKKLFESEVKGKLQLENAAEYWNFMTDVVAPVVAALSKADDAMKEKIKSEVFESIHTNYPDGEIAIDSYALVICGEK